MTSTAPRPIRSAKVLLCLLIILSTTLLAGCADNNLSDMFNFFDTGEEEQITPESLAIQGMDEFNRGRYSSALKTFEQIMDRYPFSSQALLAELKAADCHYYMGEYEEAKLLYKEFEERHPTNEAIPYVLFQIGMCDFKRTDRIDRDISGAQDAIQSFSRLLRAYPDSPYSREARARIKAAREFLVNHEYFVATFYVRTKKYDQAIHRLKYLLATYPDSAIAPKARKLLQRLEEGNPPKMGIAKWLPDFNMPDWLLYGEDTDKKENKDNKGVLKN
ncbi:hypothetical protein GF1_25720 [Desulfolithobacter dissulfuricans]|uniref:Outer membrane lipoprotein BamD-like domain-containing protein n=1 Tax=Desulfolithobacter dissulfuricans TaxID=2795293 RepID=A0A915XLN9_9BACT|nr:outer membrane protein assembly factor BamD [Desulfolithobacter dissulfuricans]BCO10196.1 hypothetical protein GF1_25720 [Desulfolithobacter dissulfuricans]